MHIARDMQSAREIQEEGRRMGLKGDRYDPLNLYQDIDDNDRGKEPIQETTFTQQVPYSFGDLGHDLTASTSVRDAEHEESQNAIRRRNQEDKEYQGELRRRKISNDLIFAQALAEQMEMDQGIEKINANETDQ